MARIRTLANPVSQSQFLSSIRPAVSEATETSGRVLQDSNRLMTESGIRAGQRLNLEFDDYFPAVPNNEGFESEKLLVHWKAGGKEGDATPAPGSGWWGYGTKLGFDVPSDVSGPMELSIKELRKDGEIIDRPGGVVMADVMPADAPIVKFDESWDNVASEKLVPGGALKIAYDIDRLKSRLRIPPGDHAGISVMVSFNGRAPESRPVLTTDALGEHVNMPEFRIPNDATSYRLWFSGGAQEQYRDRDYDSDYGADFTGTIG